MRAKALTLALVVSTVAGCSGMNNTEKGLATGGAVGGILGAGLGSMAGRPGAGAAIGAGLGALTGTMVGADIDRDERRQARQAAALRNPPLSLQEIVGMAQRRVPDDIIVRNIHQSGSAYQLNSSQINYLYEQGVSDRVIREMQLTVGAVGVPVRPVTPVYYVPDPAPPVSVGVGFGYTNMGRRRW